MAVAVHAAGTTSPAEHIVLRRTLPDDESLPAGPSVLAQVTNDLETLPTVPWGAHAQQHHALLVQTISSILIAKCPLPERKPRKHWISLPTWEIIESKPATMLRYVALGDAQVHGPYSRVGDLEASSLV